MRETAQVRAITIHGVHVELVQRPHVALRWIGLGRAETVVHVAGPEEQTIAPRQEPAASGFTLAVRHARQRRAIGAHHVLLIAGATVARRLECDPLPIAAEIRFRVLATIGDLTNVRQVAFGRIDGASDAHARHRRGCAGARRRCAGGHDGQRRDGDGWDAANVLHVTVSGENEQGAGQTCPAPLTTYEHRATRVLRAITDGAWARLP